MLTEENYYDDKMYMSTSQFKTFYQCEARGLAEYRNEYKQPTSESMLVGKYVDAYFCGTLDEFKKTTPEIFTIKGELRSNFKHAEYIIERIKKDAAFMHYLSGEKQVIMTGVIAGVPFKTKMDSVLPYCTVDLKIVKDCKDIWCDDEYKSFIFAWGYDYQGAIYQTIRSQNDGEVKPFILAVATKETEPDLRLFRLSEKTLAVAYADVVNLAPRYDMIKKGKIAPTRCGTCDYCKATKKLEEIEEV